MSDHWRYFVGPTGLVRSGAHLTVEPNDVLAIDEVENDGPQYLRRGPETRTHVSVLQPTFLSLVTLIKNTFGSPTAEQLLAVLQRAETYLSVEGEVVWTECVRQQWQWQSKANAESHK